MSTRDSGRPTVGQAGRQGDPRTLLDAAVGGDRVALGRLLSLVESAGGAADEVDRLVTNAWPQSVVGVTGPPGAGKSTLTDALVSRLRGSGHTVAVLAIDPTSPVSGGAILGDRVRMTGHAADPGVLIRSVATRGASGGLTTTVPGVLRVIGAAGFDTVILETVGVGQIELDVASVAETVVVVVTPGAGDEVQAVKAGVLEIASLFVVNKADLAGAAQTEADLLAAMSLRVHSVPGKAGAADATWTPQVVRTIARIGEGVDDVIEAIRSFADWSVQSGHRDAHRINRQRAELASRVQQAYRMAAQRRIESAEFDAVMTDVASGTESVGDALHRLTEVRSDEKL